MTMNWNRDIESTDPVELAIEVWLSAFEVTKDFNRRFTVYDLLYELERALGQPISFEQLLTVTTRVGIPVMRDGDLICTALPDAAFGTANFRLTMRRLRTRNNKPAKDTEDAGIITSKIKHDMAKAKARRERGTRHPA